MNPRIAVTVVIALTMVGLLVWFGGNGGGQIAFAEIQERLRETKSISFTQTLHVEGRPAEIMHGTILADGRMRIDLANGDYTVMDPKQGKELIVSSKAKKATLVEGLVVRFPVDLYDQLRNISQDAVKRLGQREIDGKKAIGFLAQLDVPNMGGLKIEMTVWVDPATRLPVRMERTDKDDKGKESKGVTDEIVFDGDVDESRLSLTPPAGFAVETHKFDSELQPVPNDKDLAAPQVVPKVGLGPAKFGMSTDELVKLLGKPDESRFEGTMPYHSRGYTLIVSRSRGLMIIQCYSQPAYAFRVRDFAGKTKEGIGIGSSAKDLEDAWGKPTSVETRGPTTKYIKYQEQAVEFTLFGDKVASFDLTQ